MGGSSVSTNCQWRGHVLFVALAQGFRALASIWRRPNGRNAQQRTLQGDLQIRTRA